MREYAQSSEGTKAMQKGKVKAIVDMWEDMRRVTQGTPQICGILTRLYRDPSMVTVIWSRKP